MCVYTACCELRPHLVPKEQEKLRQEMTGTVRQRDWAVCNGGNWAHTMRVFMAWVKTWDLDTSGGKWKCPAKQCLKPRDRGHFSHQVYIYKKGFSVFPYFKKGNTKINRVRRKRWRPNSDSSSQNHGHI